MNQQASLTTKKVHCKKKIDNRLKRINLKSKRMRNLIKKAIELSQMCDLDISMVVRDREMEKFTMYHSGTKQKGMFTHEKAMEDLQKLSGLQRGIKIYCDDHYRLLSKVPKSELEEQASDAKDEQDLQSLVSD